MRNQTFIRCFANMRNFQLIQIKKQLEREVEKGIFSNRHREHIRLINEELSRRK